MKADGLNSNPARGAALVELTVLLPVLLFLMFGCLVAGDLERERLRIFLVARLEAFEEAPGTREPVPAEQTSWTLAPETFEVRRELEANRWVERWDNGGAGTFGALGRWVAAVAPSTLNSALSQAKADEGGIVTASARGRLALGALAAQLLPEGAVPQLVLEARVLRRVGDWGLDEGGSSELRGRVEGWTFQGAQETVSAHPAHAALRSLAGSRMPEPMGTFLVSRAYHQEGHGRCPNEPRHPAQSGLQIFGSTDAPTIDDPRQVCFDTGAFRDRAEYAASGSVQQYALRGAYFMGCRQVSGGWTLGQGTPLSACEDSQ